MLFLARNYELVKDREKTYLTAAVAAAGTTLTIRAVDTNAWADNDYIIIGEIGAKSTEIMQVNGAVTDGTSLTIDRSGGAGGTRYAHSVDEPVYRIDYNRIEISRAATEAGTKTVLATNEIQPDDKFTRYEDVTNTTGFGFVRFNNEFSGAFSSYSDGIPYTGYPARSLGRMIRMVRRHLNLTTSREALDDINDDDIKEEINEKQRDVAQERLWPFYETIRSASSVAYQREYDIDDDVVHSKAHTITFRSDPLAKIDAARFDTLHWDTARTGEPTHASVWDNQIRVYPTPDTAADTDQLNGAITATDTTITVDSTSGFAPSGRITIESEIIAYTNVSSTAFRGCTRGLEGTTAATHADDTAVTERDIIYTAHEEPTELVDVGDTTNIPGPLVLVYGAGMELALGKLADKTLHDRLKIKYDQAIEKLRGKFGKKFTSASFRIKDRDEVITDNGRFRNPNDFPQNIS